MAKAPSILTWVQNSSFLEYVEYEILSLENFGTYTRRMYVKIDVIDGQTQSMMNRRSEPEKSLNKFGL